MWKWCVKSMSVFAQHSLACHIITESYYTSYCIRNAILGNYSCFKASFYKAKFFDRTKKIHWILTKESQYTFELSTEYNDQWFFIQLSRPCFCSLFCIYIPRCDVSRASATESVSWILNKIFLTPLNITASLC